MEPDAHSHKDVEPTYQPAHYPYVGGPKRGSKKWFIIGGIIIIVIAAAAALWFFMMHKPAPKPPVTQHTTSTTTPQLSPVEAATLQTFKSATLNVQVTYRKDWTPRESADKKELILTSPSTTYKKSDGTSTTGSFTVKIREDVPDGMQTTIQKALAAEDSLIIAYAQPAPSQRQYTNLSYAGSDANSFTFYMVTGDNAYKAGSPFGTGIDLTGTTYIIAGGYGADSGDVLAFDNVPKNSVESTVYDQGLDIIKSLQVY
ncbi:MAG TPA: hypothetical protein VLH84_03690 [Patescibacteria group bacterium]|nr:hypothetical protein [Patescibacteria group bacterium]